MLSYAGSGSLASLALGLLPAGVTALMSKPPGRFNVLVFDQGEPGRTKDPAFVTGDGFSIDLTGGPYALYTRAGYIEGGNIQVTN